MRLILRVQLLCDFLDAVGSYWLLKLGPCGSIYCTMRQLNYTTTQLPAHQPVILSSIIKSFPKLLGDIGIFVFLVRRLVVDVQSTSHSVTAASWSQCLVAAVWQAAQWFERIGSTTQTQSSHARAWIVSSSDRKNVYSIESGYRNFGRLRAMVL